METLNGEWVQHCSWNCFLVQCWKGYGSVTGQLRELVLKALSVMTKPLISRNNQKAMLIFAEEHIVWRENCSKVHFSDESKVHLFGFDWKHCLASNWGKTEARVHEAGSERWRRKCYWGMFSSAGVGTLIQIHGRWIQMFIVTSFSNMQYFPCKHPPKVFVAILRATMVTVLKLYKFPTK